MRRRNVLFLDVDGVLNDHTPFAETASNTIDRYPMELFNRLLHEAGSAVTGPRSLELVLVSAWRYMILQGHMTLQGFWHMLQTHGLAAATNPFVGFLGPDVSRDNNERGWACRKWLKENLTPAELRECRFAALDDLDLGYTHHGIALSRPDGKTGLREGNVEALLAYFDIPGPSPKELGRADPTRDEGPLPGQLDVGDPAPHPGPGE